MSSLGEQLSAILPEGASASAVVDFARAEPSRLPEAERELLVRCVPARRQEFAAGRQAARTALEALGVEAGAIGRGQRGQPLWPEGITGSIAHAAAVAVAVVARRSATVPGIGVDVEQVGAVDDQLWPLLFTPTERAAIGRAADPALAAALAFTAKEAAFKALYPLLSSEIEFHDAHVATGSDTAGDVTIAAAAPATGGDLRVPVRWATSDGLVLAIGVAPAEALSPPRSATARCV